MDYCKHYFGKSLRDLTTDDIVEFFSTQQEESESLEFKSGKGDFNKMTDEVLPRTLSAFLNSSGGVLIWGAPEDKEIEKGKGKKCIGNPIPVTVHKPKDDLINKITNKISYLPVGINVETLQYEDGFIYVFEVNESPSKPHQFNGRYFVRLDGQSKPAPHYLVDALFKRVTYPDLHAELMFHGQVQEEGGNHISISIQAVVKNNSNFLNAKNVRYYLRTNKGEFQNGQDRDQNECTHALVKGVNMEGCHRLILPSMFKGEVIIDIQYHCETSPLKIKSYKISIDQLYRSVKVISEEGMEVYKVMEMMEQSNKE